MLKIAILLSLATVLRALFGPAQLSLWAFSSARFFISLIYSIIFSKALNSKEKHRGSFSAILCSEILGGALVSLIIGWIGDQIGLG